MQNSSAPLFGEPVAPRRRRLLAGNTTARSRRTVLQVCSASPQLRPFVARCSCSIRLGNVSRPGGPSVPSGTFGRPQLATESFTTPCTPTPARWPICRSRVRPSRRRPRRPHPRGVRPRIAMLAVLDLFVSFSMAGAHSSLGRERPSGWCRAGGRHPALWRGDAAADGGDQLMMPTRPAGPGGALGAPAAARHARASARGPPHLGRPHDPARRDGCAWRRGAVVVGDGRHPRGSAYLPLVLAWATCFLSLLAVRQQLRRRLGDAARAARAAPRAVLAQGARVVAVQPFAERDRGEAESRARRRWSTRWWCRSRAT